MFTFSMLSRSSYPGPPLYLPLIRDSRKGESLRLSVEQSAATRLVVVLPGEVLLERLRFTKHP